MTGLRGVRALGASALLVLVCVLAFASAPARADLGPNLLANPGFEDDTRPPQVDTIPVHTSFDNWLPFVASELGVPPSLVTTPVHSGVTSALVQTGAGGNSTAYWVQDVGGFNPNQGYELTAWVFPSQNRQQVSLMFNWDRRSIVPAAGFFVGPGATGTTFTAWGKSATSTIPLTFGQWNEVRLVAHGDTLTSDLFVNGRAAGSTMVGQGVVAGASTTLVLGVGDPEFSDQFFYDDVSLRQMVAAGDTTPPTITVTCDEAVCRPFYASSPVSVRATATDDGGVESFKYTSDGSDPTTSSTATVVPPVISVDRTTTLRFAAIDVAGNVGTLKQDVGIDLTPPPSAELSAEDTVNSALTEFLPAGTVHSYVAWFRGGVAGGITLVAANNDPESGIVSVGFPDPGTIGDGWSGPPPSDPLRRHYDFTENATAPQPRVLPIPSVNGAGVAGPDSVLHFIVDSDAPVSTITCNVDACNDGTYDAPVTIAFNAADKQSGVASIRYTADGSDPTLTNGTTFTEPFPISATTTFKFRAFDKVGNAEGIRTFTVNVSGGIVKAATITLRANAATSEPGAAVVKLSDIPPDAFRPSVETETTFSAKAKAVTAPNATTPEQAPLGAIPLGAIPLGAIPLGAIPLGAIPLGAIGLDPTNLLLNALGGVPLVSIPLTNGQTWSQVLAGTPLANLPLQTLTLRDVLQLNPLPPALDPALDPPNPAAVPLGAIDLSHTPLGAIPLGAIALADTPLGAIPLPPTTNSPLQNWCTALGPRFCPGGDPSTLNGKSIIDIGLQGAPLGAIPLGAIPLGAIPLGAIPLGAIPLGAIDIQGSPLGAIPLGAIPVLSNVVDCTLFVCTTPGATLADAAAAHALKPGALLKDIGAYPGVTLGDVLALLFGTTPGSTPTQWESLPLDGLQAFASQGGVVTYTATIDKIQGTGLADLGVTLPKGALYFAGSTQLSLNGNAVPLAEPVQDGNELTWGGVSLVSGGTYQLVFKAHTGFELGTGQATASVAAAGTKLDTSPPSDVRIVDTFEQNATPATAQPIDDGTLYVSYTTSGSDADYYSFRMPAAGSHVQVLLSHLHADEDLVVLGPGEQPLRSSPLGAIPLGAIATGDSHVALDQQGQALTPDTLNDVPLGAIPAGDSVLGVSDNRGTADEEVDFGSAGQPGVVTIRVNHYGSRPTDTNPYVLRVQVTPPPTLPCTNAQHFDHAGEGTPGTLPAAVPANAQTLILVNEKRIGDTYGAAAEASVVGKLQTLAARSDVVGTILPVEGNPSVASAYATWDAEPCSPAKANAVVRAIGTLLDPIQQSHANLKSIVIVGTDEIVPMARLLDSTEIANETGFWPTLGFNNNEYVGAAANGFLLSDDPYGDPDPQDFLGGQLYVPKVALGRLVETPADITRQIDQFVANNGAIAPKSEFTTGYDFLTDGSQAVAGALTSDGFPGGADQIRDDWSHTDVVNGIFPGGPAPAVDSLNAHYDQHRALPALGNLQHNENDLFKSTEVATRGANAVVGRIVFTMGCHSGFSLFDGLYPAYPAQDPDGFALDWPQVYMAGGAVAFMGNTGFGLGDTAAVAYSERLNQLFAQRLDGTMTVGQALEFAKQEYFGDLGIVSLYDGKVGNEATFYGLPMTRIGTGTPAAAPAPLPAVTDPTTGLLSTSFDVQPTFLRVDKTILGQPATYFTVGGRTQITNRRPIEPRTTLDVTQPGAIAHGALLTALASHDLSITAAYSRVVMASTANEPSPGGQVAFPAKLQSIGTLQTPNGQQQRLVVIPGQFRSNPLSGLPKVGTQRLFDRLQGTVFYSNSNDFNEPTIGNVQALQVGTRVAFTTEVADANGVKQALVLYRDSSGTWRRADLACSAGRCSGGGPLSGTSVDAFVEAVDGAGNVGVASFKGSPESVTLPQSSGHITIALDGTRVNGWFSGAVRVTATSDNHSDLTTSVDGNPFKTYAGPFTVSGDGVHIVEVRGSDGSDAFATVPIDGTASTIRFTTPVNGAVFLAGDRILADYSCVDAGSGVSASDCVGTVAFGAPIDTSEGAHTFKVTATDAAGHKTTAQVTYNVWPFKGFLFPVKNPPTFNLAPAGIIVPFIFSVGGNRGMNIFEAGYPKSQQIPCASSSEVVGMDTTNSFAGLGLIFIPVVNQYVYLWKTDRAWAGTCRQFVIKFPNGSFRRANFKFK